jgi:hypothetical protein
MGARVWTQEGLSPYDPRVSRQTQVAIYGRPARPEQGEELGHFVYPLPSMIFFAPFGFLPFELARVVWITLLEIGLVALMVLSLRLANWTPNRNLLAALLFFNILWYHGARAVILGQFAVIEAVLLAGALVAVQNNRDEIGGLLLALSLSKPQMSFLLIPFVLLWALSMRRWRLLLSTIGSTILIGGIFLLLIPDWPIQWLRQVLEYPSYTATKPPVAIIASLFSTLSVWVNRILTGGFIMYLLWEWRKAWGQDDRWFQWTAAMTLLITCLTVIRTATTNYLALVPGLVLIFANWSKRWKRMGDWAIFASLLFLFALWGLFLATVEGNLENPVMYIPLPLFVLLGLWWIRWWQIRPSAFGSFQ